MNTLLEIPLREASVATIQDLQAKYPDATLRIEAENSLHSGGMDEEQFWAIIDLFNWKKREDDYAIMAPAIAALSTFPAADIHRFEDILAEKLSALDGRRFAENVGSNRYTDADGDFSVDDFLYSRCAVVANGKEFFETILQDPTRIPKEFTFESLLNLSGKAWEAKTGRADYNYHAPISYETFSNPEGWPGMIAYQERIFGV